MHLTMGGNEQTTPAQAAIIHRLHSGDRRFQHLTVDEEFAHAGTTACLSLTVAIARSLSLKSIYIDRVDDAIFIAIVRALRDVHHITEFTVHIHQLAWVADFVGMLRCNRFFNRLEIYGDEISDSDGCRIVEALWANTSMTTLVLWSRHIGDQSGTALAELLCRSSLLTLQLAGEHLTDVTGVALARALRTNSSLKGFTMNAVHLTEETSEAMATMLASNETVRYLSLQSSNWNGVAAAHLAELLRTNAALFAVNFGSALWHGLAAQHFVDALRVNSSVTSFTLSGGRLPELAEELLDQNRELRDLWWHLTMIAYLGRGAALREAVDAMGKSGFRIAIVSFFLSDIHFHRLVARGMMSDSRQPHESHRRGGGPRTGRPRQNGQPRGGRSRRGGRRGGRGGSAEGEISRGAGGGGGKPGWF